METRVTLPGEVVDLKKLPREEVPEHMYGSESWQEMFAASFTLAGTSQSGAPISPASGLPTSPARLSESEPTPKSRKSVSERRPLTLKIPRMTKSTGRLSAMFSPATLQPFMDRALGGPSSRSDSLDDSPGGSSRSRRMSSQDVSGKHGRRSSVQLMRKSGLSEKDIQAMQNTVLKSGSQPILGKATLIRIFDPDPDVIRLTAATPDVFVGPLAELYPDGSIELSRIMSDTQKLEWEDTMGNNKKWSHAAEQSGRPFCPYSMNDPSVVGRGAIYLRVPRCTFVLLGHAVHPRVVIPGFYRPAADTLSHCTTSRSRNILAGLARRHPPCQALFGRPSPPEQRSTGHREGNDRRNHLSSGAAREHDCKSCTWQQFPRCIFVESFCANKADSPLLRWRFCPLQGLSWEWHHAQNLQKLSEVVRREINVRSLSHRHHNMQKQLWGVLQSLNDFHDSPGNRFYKAQAMECIHENFQRFYVYLLYTVRIVLEDALFFYRKHMSEEDYVILGHAQSKCQDHELLKVAMMLMVGGTPANQRKQRFELMGYGWVAQRTSLMLERREYNRLFVGPLSAVRKEAVRRMENSTDFDLEILYSSSQDKMSRDDLSASW